MDLLYAGSDTIRQHGGLVDLRAGYTKRWTDGRSLDFVATHGRTDMTHDVHFTTWRWDSTRRAPMVTRRSEHNVDRTHLWSAHARADRPMGTAGWRVGALGTATRLSHPKIPNYEIMNVPRDPGTTYAFNAGVGVSHAGGPATFGMDVVLEPITSETWADAERDTARTGGGVIPKGARTIENAFRFNNAILRFGFGHQPAATDSGGRLGYQLGVAVKKIDYRLEQVNHVQGGARRTQREHWVEWSPTFAVRYAARAYDFEYAFRATCGPSPCGSGDRGIVVSPVDAASPGTGGIIVAPSRPIDLDLGSSYSHRLAVIIPIR